MENNKEKKDYSITDLQYLSKKSRFNQGRKTVTKKDHGYFLDEASVIYRSSYELKAIDIISTLYKAGRIKSWKYEVDVFQYEYSLDGKMHRYYMDFTLEMKSGKTIYIEVKPYHETIPPKGTKKNGYQPSEQQVATFIKNTDKWDAVSAFCKRQNRLEGKELFSFVIWTEKELGIGKKRPFKR